MNIDQADPAELAALRAAFDIDDGGESALGWEAVHAFEAEHGIVLPEPYRTFVAEITDGSYSGPPEYGLLSVAELPADWGDDEQERDLSKPFPLAEAWMWEEDSGTRPRMPTRGLPPRKWTRVRGCHAASVSLADSCWCRCSKSTGLSCPFAEWR
ncbi:SMI1/KNR4 family protein, partial [Streptomyces sp. 5K101]|uniref:SMI1/KNR4 family protein n=1 Tax=Streptomyces sp. 5K101 TaxID=3390037 RepID=UPI0039756F68